MKKNRSWGFSQGGAALFVLFLFVPLLVRMAAIILQGGISKPSGLVGIVCFIFMFTLIWFISVRLLISKKLWGIPRSWYEAGFALSGLYLFFALFIFVTGHTPSKYSHPVPREAGFYWLYIACLPFFVGLLAYGYARKRGLTKNSTRRGKKRRAG